MNDLFAGLQTQNSSHFWRSLNGLAKKRVADRMRGPAIIRYQPEETVKRTRVIVCCHKCTFALAPDQHVFSCHFIDGFANGSLTNVETRRQLPFTRYRIARMEHNRWNAEKYINGFVRVDGVSDKNLGNFLKGNLKCHWDLVPFDDLDAETQAYDTFTFKMAPVIAHLNKKRILKRKV